MFPLAKTLESFFKAKLIKFIVLDILIVLAIISGFTYFSVSYADSINIDTEWIKSILKFLTGGFALIVGWFILPILMPLIAGIFSEMVIKRVEGIYYPNDTEDKARFWPDMIHDIKFTLYSLFLNIIIIPLYFIGIGFIASIILNSYLLGREFFESAAGYHLGKPEANKLRKKHNTKIYLSGFALTVMALIPILNLFLPIIAIVWMVHVYHKLKTSR